MNRNCEENRNRIDSYIDGYITDEELAALKAHIDGCDECTVLFEDLKLLSRELKENLRELPDGFHEELHAKLLTADLPDDSASPDQKPEIPSAIGSGSKKGSGRKRARTALIGAAAVLLLLIVPFALRTWMNPAGNMADSMARVGDALPPGASGGYRGESLDGFHLNAAPMFEQGKAEIGMSIAESPAPPAAPPAEQMKSEPAVTDARKIVYTYSFSLEVERLNERLESLTESVRQAGGYVEQSEVAPYDRMNDLYTASLTIRLPVARTEATLELLRGLGRVLNESKSASDVTMVYSDTEAELANLQAGEQRYLQLYQRAEIIEDMIAVEKELIRIRGQIDILSARMRSLENMVSLATVHISMREVQHIQPVIASEPNVWQRASDGLIATVNGMIAFAQIAFILLVSALPVLIVCAAVGLIVYVVVRRKVRNNKKKEKSHEKNA